jgi:hypothetical protein
VALGRAQTHREHFGQLENIDSGSKWRADADSGRCYDSLANLRYNNSRIDGLAVEIQG